MRSSDLPKVTQQIRADMKLNLLIPEMGLFPEHQALDSDNLGKQLPAWPGIRVPGRGGRSSEFYSYPKNYLRTIQQRYSPGADAQFK